MDECFDAEKRNRPKAMPADGMTAASKMGLRHIPRQPSDIRLRCFRDTGNNHVIIGKERYVRSAHGHLMPLRKDKPPR
jgi:hypothetical protein